MVVESLYTTDVLKQQKLYGFVIGFAYSVFGMVAGLFLFPENPTFVAIGITALLLLPTIRKTIESIQSTTFIKDARDVFFLYLLIFLGILLSFSIFALLLPGGASNFLFSGQLEFLKSGVSTDSFYFGTVSGLLSINIKVLLVSFVVSFFFGTGAVFLVTWNASVFGAIYGALSKSITFSDPALSFVLLLLSVLPHIIIEASSYIVAGITGVLLSKLTLSKKLFLPEGEALLRKCMALVICSIVLLVIGAVVESKLAPILANTLVG